MGETARRPKLKLTAAGRGCALSRRRLIAGAVAIGGVYGNGPIIAKALAETKNPAGGLPALNEGEMAAFEYAKEPAAPADVPFTDADGQALTLTSFKGKTVLLNLWATWCAPCLHELPGLDRLQGELGSDKFEVVALCVDRKGIDGATKFHKKLKLEHLRIYADDTMKATRKLKATGVPATYLINAEGLIIGHLMGPAVWDSEDAKRLVTAVLAG